MDFAKQHIKTSVVACIIDGEQRVLLTRRCIEPFCGAWVMPGGKIDLGESILQALHREVREEVGLEVRVDHLIDVFEHVGIGQQNDHFIILYYRTTPLSFELAPNGEECTEARWVAKAELPTLPLPPGARYILGKVFPELGLKGEAPPARTVESELPGAFDLTAG